MIRNPYPDLDSLGETCDAGPRHLWIEATSRCNTRCKTCPHFYATFGVDMPDEVVDKLDGGMLDGVRDIDLIGCGEPFIARHWERIFQRCADRRMNVEITTNGIRLADRELLRKLVRSNVTLAFSCDGARKATYEFVRPLIKWEHTVAAFERIAECIREAGSERRFSWRINFVAMKKNIGDVPDLVRIARKYGASSVYVMQLSFSEDLPELPGQSLNDSPELVVPPMLEALRLGFVYGIHVSVPYRFREHILNTGPVRRLARKTFLAAVALRSKGFRRVAEMALYGFGPRSKYSSTYCPSPWRDSFIGSNGVVHPCCVDHPLGDLTTQSWHEIWNGPAYRNLRRTIHSWNPTRACRVCEHSKGLNGGDRDQYARYFAKYRAVPVALDAIDAQSGLYPVEFVDGKMHHRWTAGSCRFSVPIERPAAFVRFRIMPLAPNQEIHPGRCIINGAPAEPFDNTCEELHFPIDHVRGGRLDVQLELERHAKVEGDPRELGLAIVGIEILSID